MTYSKMSHHRAYNTGVITVRGAEVKASSQEGKESPCAYGDQRQGLESKYPPVLSPKKSRNLHGSLLHVRTFVTKPGNEFRLLSPGINVG